MERSLPPDNRRKSPRRQAIGLKSAALAAWGLIFFAAQGLLVRVEAQIGSESWSPELKKLVRINWEGVELRAAIRSTPALESGVWLDRRINPQQPIAFSGSGEG